jgi:hypothetical protein
MFDDLKNALLSVGVPVYRYSAQGADAPYIVWAEDGETDALSADDRKVLQAVGGTIDLFTFIEDDPVFMGVQTALNNAEISWNLNSVQYEDDTGLIHFEWTWQVPVL